MLITTLERMQKLYQNTEQPMNATTEATLVAMGLPSGKAYNEANNSNDINVKNISSLNQSLYIVLSNSAKAPSGNLSLFQSINKYNNNL